jgi:hypothetical protein
MAKPSRKPKAQVISLIFWYPSTVLRGFLMVGYPFQTQKEVSAHSHPLMFRGEGNSAFPFSAMQQFSQ